MAKDSIINDGNRRCQTSERRRGGRRKKSLTAHDLYQLLVGEIGQPRKEVLYELQLWEIILIIRGYRRRYKTYCEMTRWKTWVLAGTQVKLSDSGIQCPEDMLPLPWDKKDENGFSGTTLTKEEEERLRAMMREENEKSGVTD